MKKLLIILLPMFVCFSFFFYMKGEIFNFNIFLDIIREWSFDSGYDVLLELKNIFDSALTYIRVGSDNGSIGLQFEGIIDLLKSLVLAPVYLFSAIVLYLGDLVHNIGMIFDFLLF